MKDRETHVLNSAEKLTLKNNIIRVCSVPWKVVKAAKRVNFFPLNLSPSDHYFAHLLKQSGNYINFSNVRDAISSFFNYYDQNIA